MVALLLTDFEAQLIAAFSSPVLRSALYYLSLLQQLYIAEQIERPTVVGDLLVVLDRHFVVMRSRGR